MKKKIWLIPLVVILIFAGAIILLSKSGHLTINLPIEHKEAFSTVAAQCPAMLNTSGNILVDNSGQPVTLQGVMPADPAVMRKEGNFNQSFFEDIAASGANVVRIPVHPERWEQDPDYLWRYLDPLVTWNCQQGIYTIIDLHFIGNIDTNSGSHMADISMHSKEFSIAFWKQVAAYFKNAPNVIFEIFNEPADIGANTWRSNATEIVEAIRSTGAEQVIIIGGVEYSRDLSWILSGPVPGENLAYAAHIYPAHNKSSWDYWFGDVSENYPVLVTEWGWLENTTDNEQSYLVGSLEAYGQPLMNYLESHGIGWVACWYDDEWMPAMFNQGFTQMNEYGKFIQSKLKNE